jgi:hypothetical protein
VSRWLLAGLCVAVTPFAYAITVTVTNINDAGPGSLRDAIDQVNNAGGAATHSIAFNIPGAGPRIILPQTPLPIVRVPVSIDGYTQPGASPNSDAKAHNGVLRISLDGTILRATSELAVDGLTLAGAGSHVRGLVVGSFRGAGIRVLGGSSRVTGNFLGIDAAGQQGDRNRIGVAIAAGASDCIIGGVDPASRNVISGNSTGI